MEEGMEKRLLLSFALSILVLFAFSWFLSPTGPEQADGPAVEAPASAPEAPAATPPATPAGPVQAAGPEVPDEEAPDAPLPAAEVRADAPVEVTLATDRYALAFSNRGAVLRSVALPDYVDGTGQPLELIRASEVSGWPLEIRTGDPATDAEIRDALFAVEEGAGEVRMRYAAAGLEVVKAFRVDPDRYRLEAEINVLRNGAAVPFSVVWQGGFGERYSAGVPFAGGAGASVVYLEGEAFERLAAGDIESPDDVPPAALAGVADRYFMAVFLLPGPVAPRVEGVAVASDDGEEETAPRIELAYPNGPVGIYIGPQQERHLADVDPRLTDVIDYGFFGFLSRPMMLGLVLIHDSVVGNWGWAIILLTIVINIAFFPLRLKQQLSMQKMQKIQPQMRTLQDKYKKLKPNDPRRPEVQAEMVGLYKKHGVNPLGGCLPLLLQMPFLIAVFWLLQVSIELRQAPWALWIQDLAAPDPYYILPILFGVSMFVQQKMMPTSPDPTQARIMMIMPPMLTVLFLNSQSGLMLYWLTSNVFGVGQQAMIRKYWAPASSPKREAARKPDGSAKTGTAPADAPGADASASEEPAGEPGGRRRRRRRK